MDGEAQRSDSIIPEADFREAITACRKDPELDRYFRMAPQGARRFIGLGFYSTHFGERMDKQRYADYLARVEPELTENDLRYLIRFEPDKAVKRHLRELLAKPRTPPPPKAEEPKPVKKPAAKPKPSAPRRKEIDFDQLIEEDEPQSDIRRFAVVLSLAAAVLVAVIAIGLCIKLGHDLHERDAELDELRQEVKDLRAAKVRRKAQPVPRQPVRVARTVATELPTPLAEDEAPEETPDVAVAESPSAETAVAESAPTPVAGREKVSERRVTFTDGRRIVRHADGSVEVPRAFSYSGAGLKKPFWPYDAALAASGKMEAEARREAAALKEWRMLRNEALRQAVR